MDRIQIKNIQLEFPVFDSGKILSKEMLENLRDVPLGLMECLYSDLSDGIVCGFNPTTYLKEKTDEQAETQSIRLSRGIIKHNQKVYLIPGSGQLYCGENNGKEMRLLLRIGESDGQVTYEVSPLEATTDDNEYEIGRFKLKVGEKLNTEYKNLENIERGNCLNIVHARYAGYGNPTLSPKIIHAFVQTVLADNPSYIEKLGAFLTNQRINYYYLEAFFNNEGIELEEPDNPSDPLRPNQSLFDALKELADNWGDA